MVASLIVKRKKKNFMAYRREVRCLEHNLLIKGKGMKEALPGNQPIDELNTISTSIDTWLEFCDICLKSEFYDIAFKKTGNAQLAAALTLLHNYIHTFRPEERIRLENEDDYFYKYAESFINELAPFRYNKNGYNTKMRTRFLGKIRFLLVAQKDEKGNIINKNQYEFIRAIVRFCSSLRYIIKVFSTYKKLFVGEQGSGIRC